MRGSIKYHMGLRYKINLEPIPDEEGGGYVASIPELGEKAFRAEGDSAKEALFNLEEVKRDLFQDYLNSGVTIPEPKRPLGYSGKFVVRIEPRWHKHAAEMAELRGESLNQYVVNCLIHESSMDDIDARHDELICKFEQRIEETVLTKYRLLCNFLELPSKEIITTAYYEQPTEKSYLSAY